MAEDNYKILKCFHCGNEGMLKIEHIYEHCFGGPVFDDIGCVVDCEPTEKYRWHLLSCPVCHKATLYEECDDECLQMTVSTNNYPQVNFDYSNIPLNIKTAFEAALKVKNIDAAICLLSLRRVLEAICKDMNAEGSDLNDMIKDLMTKQILPPMFEDACWIIRKLGNSAAHADDRTYYMNQVEQTISFVQTIIEYLYVLPEKMHSMKDKLQKSKI